MEIFPVTTVVYHKVAVPCNADQKLVEGPVSVRPSDLTARNVEYDETPSWEKRQAFAHLSDRKVASHVMNDRQLVDAHPIDAAMTFCERAMAFLSRILPPWMEVGVPSDLRRVSHNNRMRRHTTGYY